VARFCSDDFVAHLLVRLSTKEWCENRLVAYLAKFWSYILTIVLSCFCLTVYLRCTVRHLVVYQGLEVEQLRVRWDLVEWTPLRSHLTTDGAASRRMSCHVLWSLCKHILQCSASATHVEPRMLDDRPAISAAVTWRLAIYLSHLLAVYLSVTSWRRLRPVHAGGDDVQYSCCLDMLRASVNGALKIDFNALYVVKYTQTPTRT